MTGIVRNLGRSRAPHEWAGRDLDRCTILFVTHAADRSGAPLLLLWFLRWLRANTRVQFEVLILRDGPLVADFEELAPVHVIPFLEEDPPAPRSKWAAALGWGEEKLLAEHEQSMRSRAWELRGFDVLYVNSALSGAVFDVLPEIPPVVITSLHDMGISFSIFVAPESRDAILAKTDWYVTCADAVTATLVGGFDVDRSRIVRHHGFIEPLRPNPEGEHRLRERLGIGPDSLIVGAAGAIQWRKGPDLFVQMADTVLRLRPDLDVHFVWAGGADPHGEAVPVAHDISTLGIGDRCHVLGKYDSAATVIGSFDVFCLTSREDPFPLVMLEAAGLEVPIVSFNAGGVTELASASGDPEKPLALIVDYLDIEAMAAEVIALLDDPQARKDLADRAQDHVLSHHVAEAAAPLLYEDLNRIVQMSQREWPEAAKRGHHG